MRISVDKLIQQVRKAGQAPENILFEGDVMDVYMTTVDGSGAQGVMILTRHEFNYQLLGFVLKENVGVVDAWISPSGLKREMMEVIKEGRRLQAIERTSMELIKLQIPAFLALNASSGTTPDHELIRVLEVIGLESWNPEGQSLKNFLPEALQALPSEEEVNVAQKKSKSWVGKRIGSNWGDQEDLEANRENWQERMVRMALWTHYAINKNRNRESRDFAIVSWLLGEDIPFEDIELMNRIAYKEPWLYR